LGISGFGPRQPVADPDDYSDTNSCYGQILDRMPERICFTLSLLKKMRVGKDGVRLDFDKMNFASKAEERRIYVGR